MKLKNQIKLKDTNLNTANDKYNIISYIHYKKYSNENNQKNIEIIYCFITSKIYELSIVNDINNLTIKKKEYNCKRISHKIDGVIDMSNGDLITTSHMYPVICWRKDSKENFYEYKILTEEKPYIKNAVNIIHLPDNEFTFTSNSWPSIKFFKFDINDIKDNYTLIKDMKLNCSGKKNTLALYKKDFIIVALNFEQLCLIDVKNKEIVSKITGIDLQYIFIRSNEDILMRGHYQNNNQRLNIYRFKEGELVFSGILQNKLQISVEEIMEDEDGKLFISGYEYNFNGNEKENKINKIYLLNK